MIRLRKFVVCFVALACSTSIAAEPSHLSRDELQQSLKLLESSAETYIQNRKCFTCHHQALPAMVLAAAERLEFKVSKPAASKQTAFTQKYFKGRIDRVRKANGVPGGPYTAGYALLSFAVNDIAKDETTNALVSYLKQTQKDDGSWRIRTHRPPLEDSDFTATALSIRGLQSYNSADESDELKSQFDRAVSWLKSAKSKTTEDRAFRLLGLHWSNVDEATIKPFQERLLQQQRDDGGWAQFSKMESDAYATGQALVSLQRSGVATDSTGYQAGLEYLKSTRKLDGSWHVKSRSRPIQTYFESGFPHGKDQFISICATSWATMAFLAAMD